MLRPRMAILAAHLGCGGDVIAAEDCGSGNGAFTCGVSTFRRPRCEATGLFGLTEGGARPNDARKPGRLARVAGGVRTLGCLGGQMVGVGGGRLRRLGRGSVGGGVEGAEDGQGVGVGVGWLVAAAAAGG